MTGSTTKWWVWTRHGDVQYSWVGDTMADAVERFCEQHHVASGTSVYAARAEDVQKFVVGAKAVA